MTKDMLMVWLLTEQKPEPDSGDQVSTHSEEYLDTYLIDESLTVHIPVLPIALIQEFYMNP